MKVVDTSIWIDFLRGRPSVAGLAALLREDDVLMHPWVLGEIALGNLGRQRAPVLQDLASLPAAPVIDDVELRAFIEHHGLAGTGLGLVDVQVLASARLAGADLWTGDLRMVRSWARLQAGGA